jgi:predicted phosphodiesterase
MQLRTVREYTDNGTQYTFYPLGDIHLGSANCDVGHFLRTIDTIRENPNARWVGMGDYVEWITPKDKRWQAGGIDERIVNMANLDRIGDVYVEKISTLLRPIIDKCWAFGAGNHEKRFEAEHHTNLCRRILQECDASDELYTGWGAITRVVFHTARTEQHPLRIFHSHGWQGGRMDGAKVNAAQRLMAYIDADIYLQGHSHSRFVVPASRLSVNQSWTRVTAQDVYVAHTGSFMRTYADNTDGYGEQAGYPPTSLGMVRFMITPTHDGILTEAVQ